MEKRITILGRTETGIFAQGLFSSMEKTAAPVPAVWDTADKIRDYIKTITAEDRKKFCYVLVNALGAGEFFGSNINSDFFPWDVLCHEGDDYGYKTFFKAHAYTHHANKDSSRAIGIPVVAVLNHKMKRVELIIRIDREKARKEGADGIITRIDNGEFPDVSMGCKVPFDVCSICGQHSKTRDDYCQHMRPPEEMRGIWGPNRILPDGRRIYVINTMPRFFDISFVFIGADKTAKVMAKLASKGNQVCLGSVCALPGHRDEDNALYDEKGDRLDAGLLRKTASAPCDGRRGPCGRLCADCGDRTRCESEKLASAFGVKMAARKLGSIIKDVPGGTFAMRRLPALESAESDIPKDVLNALAKFPLRSALGTSASAGMVLKPQEFQRIVLIRIGEGGLADELDAGRNVFRDVHRFDDDADPVMRALPEILRLILPLVAGRTAFGPQFRARVAQAGSVGEHNNALPTRTPIEHPLLDKISAAYNGYRRNVLLKLSQAGEEVVGDSKLREAVLGNELVNMFTKTASTHEIISHDSVAYMMSAHLLNRSLLASTVDSVGIEVANSQLLRERQA
jgi:hypothetical protein